jgi:hypothetical protein
VRFFAIGLLSISTGPITLKRHCYSAASAMSHQEECV